MRNSKLFMFLLIILIFPGMLLAATRGKITGIVIDKSTGEPLPGVNILLKGTFLGASSYIDGTYFILNVPAGNYELEASYIGYQTITVQNVRVQSDLTTTQHFQMQQSIMELEEEIVVIAERPLIQQDLTASRTIASAEEIAAIPFENVEQILNITPGFVDGHARGGRDGEILYQIDGVTTLDPWNNTFDTDVPEFAIEEVSVMTGGFSTEFGNAQSGVVNMVIKEGTPQYRGKIRYKTSDFGNSALSDHHRLQNVEFSLGGPEPISKFLFGGYENRLKLFVAGEWRKDNGRKTANWYDTEALNSTINNREFNIQSKITWTPHQKHKFSFSYLGNWNDYGRWDNLYKQKVNEDRNSLMPQLLDANLDNYDPENPLASWWGNGKVDTEDLNFNGFLDPGEDLNGNGKVDTEDLNHNRNLDVYDMLDHLPVYEANSDNLIFSWTYQVSSKSFLEAKFSRFRTSLLYNVNENINEDYDGDGVFDLFINGVDMDGDGDNRHEDLNGNNIWDWKVDNGKTDLYRDDNDNDYIDASENGPRESWIPWTEIPFGNMKDNDGFYTYGPGPSYYRLRWSFDEKFHYAGKIAFYSQIDNHNEIKLGTEYNYYDIFAHDRDLASGGNVYGQTTHVYPFSAGAFIEDKMEYEGMILNAGMRMDYFGANTNVPGDLNDPVELGEGDIKDPQKTKTNFYLSPRFGISHPITNRDVIYFNYGRYFQIPRFFLLYSNLTYDLSGAFPLVGNPNIEPERTTSYELGLKHQFTDNLKIELKGFYKDIQGLTDTRQVYYTAANYFTIYQNLDYGNIRGFEVQLYQRFSRYWNGMVNYTYSIAKGKSSSYRHNYDLTWAGDIVPTEETFLDWDQTHTLNANLHLRIPENENLFGLSFLNNISTNFVFRYGSGLPYSSTARTRIPPINDKRLPATYVLDMILDKRVIFSDRYAMRFFVWGNHLEEQLFKHRNLLDIAPVNPDDDDVEWYEQFGDPTGRYHDPSVYSPGTQWRFGVEFEF